MTEITQIQKRMQQLDVAIGQRLGLYRRQARISQKVLGERIGCSFQQVQKYESGANHITAPRLILAAEALSIPPAQLLAGAASVADTNQELHNPLVQLAVSLSPRQQAIALKILKVLHEYDGR